jgi:hypothetical protein
MNKMNVFFLVIFALTFISGTITAQKTWVEKNKSVVIEAENVQGGNENTQWKLAAEPAGWTGSSYLVWKGTSIWGHDSESKKYDDIEDARKLICHIKVNNKGTYYLKVRNYHVGQGSGDHAFDVDNDCYVSINKGDFGKQYDFNAKAFTWCETGNWRKAYFEEGIYEVSIAGRSEDFGIDRICLLHEV